MYIQVLLSEHILETIVIGEHIYMNSIQVMFQNNQSKHCYWQFKVMSRVVLLRNLELSKGIYYHLLILHEDTIQTYYRSIKINHKPISNVNTRVVLSLSFNSWKLFSHDSDHSNLELFLVKPVNGDVIDENPSTDILQYPDKSKKLQMLVGLNGLGQLLSAFVFLGSTSTP